MKAKKKDVKTDFEVLVGRIQAMSDKERLVAEDIVKQNVFDPKSIKKQSARVAAFLSYYLVRREDIPVVSETDKAAYIAEFEASCTREISNVCRELLAKC